MDIDMKWFQLIERSGSEWNKKWTVVDVVLCYLITPQEGTAEPPSCWESSLQKAFSCRPPSMDGLGHCLTEVYTSSLGHSTSSTWLTWDIHSWPSLPNLGQHLRVSFRILPQVAQVCVEIPPQLYFCPICFLLYLPIDIDPKSDTL